MTIQECYSLVKGDYKDVINRFGTIKLVDKFLLRFCSDDSINQLIEANREGNIEEAFRAAHTFKGVTSNVALTTLFNMASEITEQLRPRENKADEQAIINLKKEYDFVIKCINEYEKSKTN